MKKINFQQIESYYLPRLSTLNSYFKAHCKELNLNKHLSGYNIWCRMSQLKKIHTAKYLNKWIFNVDSSVMITNIFFIIVFKRGIKHDTLHINRYSIIIPRT